MQDPTTYVNQLGIALACAANPAEAAAIDDKHLARVNHEIYYFATERARSAFLDDARARCGIVTDPVSKRRFRPGTDAPRIDHAGRPWFFSSDSTRTLFAAMPDSFLSPRYSMKPKASG